jgi:hypothetical protein
MNYTISKGLAKSNSLMQELVDMKYDYGELTTSTRDLSTLVRQQLYFPLFNNQPTTDIRSEIRSLKGLFLSKRNFPSVN